MGPIWGRQDPGGAHIGPMIFAIWAIDKLLASWKLLKMIWYDKMVVRLSYFYKIDLYTGKKALFYWDGLHTKHIEVSFVCSKSHVFSTFVADMLQVML